MLLRLKMTAKQIIKLPEIKKISMKKISVLLFLSGFIFSCNNDLQRIETTYTNGNLKEIYYINSKGEKEGKDYEFYENNKLKNVFNYKNGRFEGKAYLFDKKGVLRMIENYKNHHLVDTSLLFTNDGSLLSNVIYGKNEDTLKISWFYPNGRIFSENSILEGYSFDIEGPNNTISYNSEGKINKDSSHYVSINYVNNNSTNLKFNLCEYKWTFEPNYIKDYVEVFIMRDFKYGINWEKRCVRKFRFSNWDNITLNTIDSDYTNGLIYIVIDAFQKSKLKANNYILSSFEVQLKKGDKSRWHNVHPTYR